MTHTSSGPRPGATDRREPDAAPVERRRSLPVDVRLFGLAGVLVALCLVGYLTNPATFLTEENISTMLRLAAAIGVVSVGMTFVIIAGGIDLSVGSIVALSSVWMTTVATQSYGPVVMVGCALLVGVGCGLVNGILVAYGRVVPFITTLAMMASARGLAERISGRSTQIVTETGFTEFFRAEVLGIPLLVLILAAVFVIGWVVLNRTTFGRRTYAIGGNAEAARLSGINVKRQTALVYAVAGLCCGIAAVIVVARTTSGASTNGMFYELDAIAAVVIGGTLLSGGRGSLIGTLIGGLIFTVLNSIFTQNNMDTDVQNIAKGAIIVAAVLLQHTTLVRRGGKPRTGPSRIRISGSK